MKRSCTFFCIVALTQPVVAQSASDKADKRLAELLAPVGNFPRGTFASQSVAWPASKAVTANELPIKPYAGLPASLPMPPRKAVKPGSLPAGTPLLAFRDGTQVPRPIELPTEALVWVPSVDVKTPAPIPILAQPAKDRASLGDPAFEASLAAALKQITPVRDWPVPFTPLNLPDPFEHMRYGQLRNPPDENATPPVIPLIKPTQ